jgi:hypothetical protein
VDWFLLDGLCFDAENLAALALASSSPSKGDLHGSSRQFRLAASVSMDCSG